ncbi:UNVERIFIED_CONTAM: protein COBRA [Sesamum calycinum]|uniref:Protein COBRA n=1 Tax=Sesamum calycinum TaxID=2727403 RepID=A0AAW2PP51_9LAMI
MRFLPLGGKWSCYAYDALDPNGNITVKWDVMSWTPDGYVNREIVQGSKETFPIAAKKNPTIVDLLPGTPYNQQIANCCKGGVISSWVQDPANAASSFQLSVGQAGTSNKTVRVPKNFTLLGPGPGYTCGPAKIVKPSKFTTPDNRRVTQALMTWNVTCSYSQFLAQKTPTCCVSLSAFYNDTIVGCPTCSCVVRILLSQGLAPDSPHIASVVSNSDKNNLAPLVQCTSHMCPVRIHWHVKINYKEYWRVKIAITNFNYRMNYTQWNLVAQHPNFDNLTQIFSFNYEPLTPYGSINDTAMLWGVKFYNDLLMQAGPYGNVQSELLFKKDKTTFTFDKGRKQFLNVQMIAIVVPGISEAHSHGGTFSVQ